MSTSTQAEVPRKQGGFLRQSSTSSMAALLAMLSGLLLDVVLASKFGAGRASDAFFVASRIPIGLSALLMTVATQVLVPMFVRDRREGGRHSVAIFASRVMTSVVLSGLALWALAFVLADPLVSLTAPGLDSEQHALAATLTRLMFLVVPLVAAAETVRALLNASYSFVLPAAMNLFMNGLAAAIILLVHTHDIRIVAYAYIAGATFQLLVITGLAWKHGLAVRPSLHPADARVGAAAQLSRRPIVSSLLNLANRVAEQVLASFLPAGSISILSYGNRLISALGGGVFFRPVTVALLPRLADAEHAGNRKALKDAIAQALRFVLAIALPLTAFTAALAGPFVYGVFRRGNFSTADTRTLSMLLVVYSFSLVGSGMQRVLLAPFYARLDTVTPLRNTAYGVLVDLCLLLPCVVLFGRHRPEAVLGVALAFSLTQYFIVTHAWYQLRHTVKIGWPDISSFALRALLASLGSAVVMVSLVWKLDILGVADRATQLAATVVIGAVGGVVLLLISWLIAGPAGRTLATKTVRRVLRRRQEGIPIVKESLVGELLTDAPPPGSALPTGSGPTLGASSARPDGLLVLAGAMAVVAVAVATAVLYTTGSSRTEVILPAAAVGGLGFVLLALHRFEWFVLATLAIRTVVDLEKAGPTTNVLSGGSSSTGGSGVAASALAVLFIITSVLWLLAQRRAGHRFPMTPADAAFAVFVVACLLSTIGSVNRIATLTEVTRIVAAVLMFVVLERLLVDLGAVRRVLVACYVSLIPAIGLGLVQSVSGGPFESGGLSRIVGTFLHPNTFGFFLSMFMLMSIALYRHVQARTRMLLGLVVVVCGGLLVLTYSRGSWVAFVVGLVIIGVLQSRAVFAWMLGGVVVVIGLLPSVVARVTDVASADTATGAASNSLTWRFQYWLDVIGLNRDNPVTGIGLKGTRYITDQSKAPHNDFLRAYAETGLLGLLGFLLVVLAIIGIARRALRQAQPGLARGVAVGFAAVLAAYLIDSFGDNLMSEIVVLWYFYAFAACAAAVARLGSERPEPAGKPEPAERPPDGVLT